MNPAFARQDSLAPSIFDPGLNSGLPGVSLIMTLDGERPVASLRPGDRIVTRDTGTATLRATRQRRITARVAHIRAGSLGHNRPGHDAIVPAGHPILVRDWRARALFGASQALVPVARLADGEFVTLRGPATMLVHDLHFDTPHIVYVDGLELASTLVRTTTP